LLKYRLKEGVDPRLIGITSPSPASGKTTAAANLGLALAEGRRAKIMLLDLNLRRPDLAKMFNLPTMTSVADQLRYKQRSPQAPWSVLELRSHLHLMAGGTPTENPSPLLNSEIIRTLLGHLAEEYDYVVVDLPAIINYADVKSVQDLMDGLVLVLRSGSTTRSAFDSSLELLGPTIFLGILFTDMDRRDMTG